MFMSLWSVSSSGQCNNWNDHIQKDSLINAYVLYKEVLQKENYKQAYNRWRHVYLNAPAADGRRASVYSDGALLHIGLAEQAFWSWKKRGYIKKALLLMEEQRNCYPDSEVPRLPKDLEKFVRSD